MPRVVEIVLAVEAKSADEWTREQRTGSHGAKGPSECRATRTGTASAARSPMR
ncbi:hypothetical protein LMG28614_02105 [Paraburkholderia ultramafica]|uniref:Uncharacterized protein n=1 Tax=Paraburkholderia ultramafica TaxID=1544867 RepID=A0A6S7CQG6_9BURK|nr:hypothetical protein LMG28614_02105 [Paraburkholderia ultramafica]